MSFRRAYGASPLHLAGHLILFALAGFALDQIFSGGDVEQLVAWYVGFALLQDLVLIPVYSLVDRGLRAFTGGRRITNHLRVPGAISLLLLLIYTPLIFGLGASTYRFYSGHAVEGYLRSWLLVSAALFAISGLVLLLRTWRRPSRD